MAYMPYPPKIIIEDKDKWWPNPILGELHDVWLTLTQRIWGSQIHLILSQMNIGRYADRTRKYLKYESELKETEKLTKVSHKLSDDSDRTIGSEFSIEDDSIGGKKLFDIVEKSNSGIVGAAMYIDTYQDELRSETKSEFRNLVTKKI